MDLGWVLVGLICVVLVTLLIRFFAPSPRRVGVVQNIRHLSTRADLVTVFDLITPEGKIYHAGYKGWPDTDFSEGDTLEFWLSSRLVMWSERVVKERNPDGTTTISSRRTNYYEVDRYGVMPK